MLESFEKYTLYNGILYKKENSEKDEFLRTISYFEEKGYKKAFENSFGGAFFVTLTLENETVNVTYKGKSKILRVITEDGINLPAPVCKESIKVDTLITQITTSFFTADCGMSYLIRLGDGTFAVIDGSMGEYDEPQHFIELLNKQNPNGGLPIIRAWFITHPHEDHYGLFVKMITEYSDTFILENLVYNWPSKEFAAGASKSVDSFNEIAENPKGFNVIIGRTGYKFCFCGNEFDILFSPEDTVPAKFNNVNDASIILRQRVNERVVLYLADLMTPGTEILMSEYEHGILKAEILQVAHHGFWGGSNELYKTINPETLLWPLPDFHYYKMSEIEWNDFLVHSDTVKNIFYSSLEEITLNMSEAVSTYHPYDRAGENEQIYTADFGKKSLLALNWCCLTGGRTGCAPAKAEFCESGIRLTADSEKPTVLEIVKPPFMKNSDSYIFTFKCEIEGAEKFGCICNYAEPYNYSEEEIFDLSPEKGIFEYTVKASEKEKALTISRNGRVIFTEAYTPAPRHGVYLVFKNASIILCDAEVKKL